MASVAPRPTERVSGDPNICAFMTTLWVTAAGLGASELIVVRGTPAALQIASQRLTNCAPVVAYGSSMNPATSERTTNAAVTPTPAANQGFLQVKRRSVLIARPQHRRREPHCP